MLIKSQKFAEGFENRGVERQYNASTPKIAHKEFLNSCDRCCTIGVALECDRCGIATAHSSVMSIFNDILKIPS